MNDRGLQYSIRGTPGNIDVIDETTTPNGGFFAHFDQGFPPAAVGIQASGVWSMTAAPGWAKVIVFTFAADGSGKVIQYFQQDVYVPAVPTTAK